MQGRTVEARSRFTSQHAHVVRGTGCMLRGRVCGRRVVKTIRVPATFCIASTFLSHLQESTRSRARAQGIARRGPPRVHQTDLVLSVWIPLAGKDGST